MITLTTIVHHCSFRQVLQGFAEGFAGDAEKVKRQNNRRLPDYADSAEGKKKDEESTKSDGITG